MHYISKLDIPIKYLHKTFWGLSHMGESTARRRNWFAEEEAVVGLPMRAAYPWHSVHLFNKLDCGSRRTCYVRLSNPMCESTTVGISTVGNP